MRELQGFGLMQRDRNFASYEDPRGALRVAAERLGRAGRLMGRGPRRARAAPHAERDQRQHRRVLGAATNCRRPASRSTSRIACTGKARESAQQPPGAWVTQSRVGRGYRELAEDEQQFIVDFTGPSLAALPAERAGQSRRHRRRRTARSSRRNAYRVEATGAWRMMVLVKQLDAAQPVELRGYLQSGADVLTETWSNLVPPR